MSLVPRYIAAWRSVRSQSFDVRTLGLCQARSRAWCSTPSGALSSLPPTRLPLAGACHAAMAGRILAFPLPSGARAVGSTDVLGSLQRMFLLCSRLSGGRRALTCARLVVLASTHSPLCDDTAIHLVTDSNNLNHGVGAQSHVCVHQERG